VYRRYHQHARYERSEDTRDTHRRAQRREQQRDDHDESNGRHALRTFQVTRIEAIDFGLDVEQHRVVGVSEGPAHDRGVDRPLRRAERAQATRSIGPSRSRTTGRRARARGAVPFSISRVTGDWSRAAATSTMNGLDLVGAQAHLRKRGLHADANFLRSGRLARRARCVAGAR
jgi:hypothetical protein